LGDHIYLPLLLTEYLNGAGWSGHYYLIAKVPLDDPYDNALNSFELNSLGAMNMEWGLEHVDHQCLPALDACYVMQLSISTAIKDDSDDVEDPQVYFFDSITKPSVCESKLNIDATLAKICVSRSINSDPDFMFDVDIQLFNQYNYVVGFGQVASILWDDFVQSIDDLNLNFVGNCSIQVPLKASLYIHSSSETNHSAPSAHPTMSPITAEPLIAPTVSSSSTSNPTLIKAPHQQQPSAPTFEIASYSPSSSPSLKSFFGNYDYECLKECSGFPSEHLFASNTGKQRCYFLLDIYHLCSSFNVAVGLCPQPDCASTCSIDNWCYFGAGTVLSCPDLSWQGNTDDAMDIAHDCVDALKALNHIAVNNNDNDTHFSKSILAICLGELMIS